VEEAEGQHLALAVLQLDDRTVFTWCSYDTCLFRGISPGHSILVLAVLGNGTDW